ncbi:adenylate/guanylate cyclase domain-containing protein [Parasphingorhabdus sp.]|uniref:adenylate/guanylate cyclase domain-containing protein n=1 Tax=Parasphingorhabdus sp. TaxID=2709688 RepID=UPI0030B1E3C9
MDQSCKIRHQPLPFQLSFGVVTLLMFSFFAVAPLLGILVYSHTENERSALANLEQQINHNMADTQRASVDLIDTVARDMAIVAAAATANPEQFRSESSNDLLWHTLIAADQIDAIYTSFEDGYHRVVSRIDADRRRADQVTPSNANWHTSYIDAYALGGARARHRLFYSTWGERAVKGYAAPTDLDLRRLPHYMAAKASGRFALGEPTVNPDTGSLIMSLGTPIVSDGAFIGIVGANITLANISTYLGNNRLSANSITLIYDQPGRLIAASDRALIAPRGTEKEALPTLDSIANPTLAQAVGLRAEAIKQPYQFTDASGQQFIVAGKSFPPQFGKDWEILTISPTDDFIGGLKETNRQISGIIILITILELMLIGLVSLRISRQVSAITGEFEEIGQFNLTSTVPIQTIVREIANLSLSIEAMKSSLRSFGRYVPKDLVRSLLADGREAVLGGEQRRLSLHFSDVADFTTISEGLSPQDLVEAMREYFELMTGAISEEGGTVDKFMGDGILAFYNAPTALPDHALHACQSALNAQQRLSQFVNQRVEFRARIGLGIGDVVVGNMGTEERFAYTVMGDAVNLASRLEGLNKVYGTSIMASEDLRHETGDVFEWRRLDRVAVKGRQQGTVVYELLGRSGEVAADRLQARDAYEQGLACYWAGSFEAASQHFEAAAVLRPGDRAADRLLERARNYTLAPPPAGWSGTEVMQQK